MTCEKFEKLLPLHVEGELDEAERDIVEDHLKLCPGCSLLITSLEELYQTLHNLPELEISTDLKSRLYAIPERTI